MSIEIPLTRGLEIGDDTLGEYILTIVGTVDEQSLQSSFTFSLRRKDDSDREGTLTAIYTPDRRDYALKIGGMTGVDDIIICVLQKLALHGAVQAADCLRKAIQGSIGTGHWQRKAAGQFATCMMQAGSGFFTQALAALWECTSGASGAGSATDP